MPFLGDSLSLILARQMDACTLRQRVIANNVANSNTPGFKKSEVDFQQQLKVALGMNEYQMRTSKTRHFGAATDLNGLQASVTKVPDTAARAGLNNVDPDEEMVNVAANSILYSLVTRASSDRSSLMSYVIKGGK